MPDSSPSSATSQLPTHVQPGHEPVVAGVAEVTGFLLPTWPTQAEFLAAVGNEPADVRPMLLCISNKMKVSKQIDYKSTGYM